MMKLWDDFFLTSKHAFTLKSRDMLYKYSETQINLYRMVLLADILMILTLL